MAKTGRPRRNSIEAFAAAIDACIAAYEESDDAHDLTDYALAQRLFQSTLPMRGATLYKYKY